MIKQILKEHKGNVSSNEEVMFCTVISLVMAVLMLAMSVFGMNGTGMLIFFALFAGIFMAFAAPGLGRFFFYFSKKDEKLLVENINKAISAGRSEGSIDLPETLGYWPHNKAQVRGFIVALLFTVIMFPSYSVVNSIIFYFILVMIVIVFTLIGIFVVESPSSYGSTRYIQVALPDEHLTTDNKHELAKERKRIQKEKEELARLPQFEKTVAEVKQVNEYLYNNNFDVKPLRELLEILNTEGVRLDKLDTQVNKCIPSLLEAIEIYRQNAINSIPVDREEKVIREFVSIIQEANAEYKKSKSEANLEDLEAYAKSIRENI